MADLFDTRHLFRMTDCTGLLQHSVCGVPDPKEGYTSDDNARALILAVLLEKRSPGGPYRALAERYLGFLLGAEKRRRFRNFMRYDRSFPEKQGSEDCFGRCILALCFAASSPVLPEADRLCAERLLHRTEAGCADLTFPKSKAYALTGLSLQSGNHTEYAEPLRESLADTYLQNRRQDWRWFENSVTYCGGILPFALLSAPPGDGKLSEIALESLDFLLEHEFRGGMFLPVGCRGWFPKGSQPALYDEQPVEACSMMLVCRKAFQATGKSEYRSAALRCFQWYLGRNIAGASMVDPETGGCWDGITPAGLNRNEGAESLLCWLISALLAEEEGWYGPGNRSASDSDALSVP